MLLKRDIPSPPLAEQTVSVPELGGEVLVRAMLLKDWMRLSHMDVSEQASAMLAVTVFVTGEGGNCVPLYTAEEWERWGSKNRIAAWRLWGIAHDLSDGSGKEAEKNSSAQSSDSPAA